MHLPVICKAGSTASLEHPLLSQRRYKQTARYGKKSWCEEMIFKPPSPQVELGNFHAFPVATWAIKVVVVAHLKLVKTWHTVSLIST